jgi:hypothetical protein
MAKTPKPSLSVVGSTPVSSVSDPPDTLGQAGTNLWRRITQAYRNDDQGGRQLLYEACAACDRVTALRERIDADGEINRPGRVGV